MVAAGAAIAVVLAACGGSSGKSSSSTTTSSSTGASGSTTTPGVTPTSIKVGVTLIDYNCVKQFVDTIREHEDRVYNAFIDNINKQGGINGRKVVPVYNSFCPVSSDGPLAACTQLTEDDKVFAVIGSFYDLAGDAQGCIAKQHNTPLIAFELTKAIIDKSPHGMIVYPGVTNERAARIVLQLLKQTGRLKDKKVAVLGGDQEASTVNGTIVPQLKKDKVPLGSTAVLSITGTDTTAAQAQLDSFIERWKSEHVNAIFLSGDEVSSKAFVEKIRKEMPKVTLISDNTDERSAGQEETRAGLKPNPYEGLLAAGGPTTQEYLSGPNWQYCKNIYKKETGKAAPDGPAADPKASGGKTLAVYESINDTCQMVSMFHDIVARIGKDVTVANWVKTVNSFGEIANRGGGQYASINQGKYDVDDSQRLEQFDSSLPGGGDWKALTPIKNVAGQ
ncbi:MAG TPA: ABC transporter substrate-binding protein [Acidimicrobiia bacterium]|jgi:ABC-type branched-subunit amino acid transport system substrate-binding protein